MRVAHFFPSLVLRFQQKFRLTFDLSGGVLDSLAALYA